MHLNYLAYGSNLHPQRLLARVPSAQVVDTVELPGWCVCFHKRGRDQSAKCNLLFTGENHDRAWGIVYGIAIAEKPELDRVEGPGYTEQTIAVNGVGDVFYYAANEGWIDDRLLPYCWYHDFVVHGAKYHGLPKDYIEWLQQQPFKVDEDRQRRSLNRAILLSN